MARAQVSGDNIRDGVVRIHKHTSAAKALTTLGTLAKA